MLLYIIYIKNQSLYASYRFFLSHETLQQEYKLKGCAYLLISLLMFASFIVSILYDLGRLVVGVIH